MVENSRLNIRGMFFKAAMHHLQLSTSETENLKVIFEGHNSAHDRYNALVSKKVKIAEGGPNPTRLDRQLSDAWEEVLQTNELLPANLQDMHCRKSSGQ